MEASFRNRIYLGFCKAEGMGRWAWPARSVFVMSRPASIPSHSSRTNNLRLKYVMRLAKMKLISKLMENTPIVTEEIMNNQILERFPELTLKPEDSALYLLAFSSTHSINLFSSTENSAENLF